jgi:integrase
MSVRLHALRHRRRIGRVSVFQHHGGWWIYHRAGGKPCRRLIGESAAKAEYEASILNARLVASAAGLSFAAGDPGSLLDATNHSVTVGELRQQFLRDHEETVRSSLATVLRYRTATLYLQKYCDSNTLAAGQIAALPFMQFLRPNRFLQRSQQHAKTPAARQEGPVYPGMLP